MLGEVVVRFLAVVVAGSMAVAGVTTEEYAQFPRLFHLDEFESCLARRGGLYCLGTFSVKPVSEPHPTYLLMTEYSIDRHNFNRTLLHRGYCVSSRCPNITSGSPSRRFQRCMSEQLQRLCLKAELIELSYCRSHTKHEALRSTSSAVETPHRVFLYAVAVIVLLNVVGTVYDVNTKSIKKLRVLTAWSLASNWQHLKTPYPAGDPRLDTLLTLEAFRVVMVALVVFVHAGCLHHILYIQNPQHIEELARWPVMMLLQNGTASVQILLMLSSFFLADSLLQVPQPPSFTLLPKLMLKRIFRIAPLYILVMGFSATWWPLTRDGPMWPMLVGRESNICRRKFWPNVLFLQNFIEPELMCQWQTWFLAVDMQLHLVGCVIMLWLPRRRGHALWLLGAGFLGAVLLNAYRGYVNDWKIFMFVSMPNNIHNKFETTPSFSQYYTHPCGSLPAALLGLFMAHLLHHLRDMGFKPQDHKRLIMACQLVLALMPCWTAGGWLVRGGGSRLWHALLLALERPGLLLLAALLLFGICNGSTAPPLRHADEKSAAVTKNKGYLRHVFSWSGWFTLGRLSLPVLLLHWCINCMLAGSSLMPITTSTLHTVADTTATMFLSYLLAVPLTLTVELPFQKLYSVLIT
ncbi:nose resistant to fluoxetine protein 6 [Helicoverpa armigera]|uniref:nose resistant to fluoxetine protein 6 n=1 Tax=Helicoverpa armigera TaxID=29058 RepID=UPI0030833B66